MTAPDHGYSTRDIPPDVLSAADMVSIQIRQMLGGFPVTLAAMAYRRGRDDAAGGPADVSHAALVLTAKAVNRIRPGVEVNTALAAMQTLLTLGWRPPPGPATTDAARLAAEQTEETP